MPTETIYTGNYIGKTLNNIGLTQQLESGVAANEGAGIYTKTILGVGDKYQIDLYGSLQTHKPKETPFLTLLESIGSEGCDAPYYIWTDEYKGTQWWDISLDTLRTRNAAATHDAITALDRSGFQAGIAANTLSVRMNSEFYGGGIMKVVPLSAVGATTAGILGATGASGTSPITAMTAYSAGFMYGQAFVPVNGVANVAMFAIKNEATNVGNATVVWNKIRVLLANLGYVERVYATNNSSTCTGRLLRYSLGTTAYAPAYMAFPNISLYKGSSTSGTKSTYTQVLARLEAVWFGKLAHDGTDEYLVFAVNFGDCNEPITIAALNGTTTCDSVMVSQPSIGHGTPVNATAVFGTTAGAAAPYAGSMSRMLMVGNASAVPQPVPEGDKFVMGGGLTLGREQMMNNTQIFASKSYGVTGTHQASKFRFGDDFQNTRDFHFSLYKKQLQAALMYGIKSETIAVHSTNGFMSGQPVRSTSGLMDYAMFPIRHIKKPLAGLGWNASYADAVKLIAWLEEIGDNLAAFREGDQKTITFMTPQNFINKLNMHMRAILGNTTNGVNAVMGGMITRQAPGAISLELEHYEYITQTGVKLIFIHDPSMDYTPSINVPHWIYGQSTLPMRDVLIAIDPKNMKRKVLRADKIYGNIQDPGQDAFLEGIRGECGFMLRFPQNHAFVYVPSA